MLEDVTKIILNLKKVALKINGEDKQDLEIDVTGPLEVTAGDIQGSSDVEILNPDQYICTVADGATFHARLSANTGRDTFRLMKTRPRQMTCQLVFYRLTHFIPQSSASITS